MKICIFFVFFLVCFISYAKERIIITGSSTIAPVISELAKLYESQNNNVRVDVQTGGSTRGLNDVRRKLADIGMVSRGLKESERDLKGIVFAKDGLAIIVNKANPLNELSSSQIIKIYKGKIKNWKELGGVDGKIVVVNKAEGRSTLEVFLKFFNLKNSQIIPTIIIGDNEHGIKTVINNKHSIAYVSVGTAEYNVSKGLPIKLLKYKGVIPSIKNIINNRYNLTRDLTLVLKDKSNKNIKSFLKFISSFHAKKIIQGHFFVPYKQH